MAKDTRTDLVRELRSRPATHARAAIIAAAERGEFHDYYTTRVSPKRDLVDMLHESGDDDLGRAVVLGEYDETLTMEEARALFQELMTAIPAREEH